MCESNLQTKLERNKLKLWNLVSNTLVVHKNSAIYKSLEESTSSSSLNDWFKNSTWQYYMFIWLSLHVWLYLYMYVENLNPLCKYFLCLGILILTYRRQCYAHVHVILTHMCSFHTAAHSLHIQHWMWHSSRCSLKPHASPGRQIVAQRNNKDYKRMMQMRIFPAKIK